MAPDLAALTRNAVKVLPEGELERKLELGRPLRVKLGIDPTARDIHIGQAIPLQRMRAFQDQGHIGVLIVGDYTARVGDPSGRSKERRVLTDAEIDANAKRYFAQALRILDPERTELRFNGEWLAKIDFAELLRLTRIVTVSRLLERDDFERRFKANQPISVSEFLYPLMQGYDSVAIHADVELGGTDQEYNLLTGRDIQQAYGQDPQVALTTPLINGPNGVDKMSASLGNYIAIDDPPAEMYGKAMSCVDELMPDYYRLCLEADDPPPADPYAAKREFARRLVERWHGAEAAAAAEAGVRPPVQAGPGGRRRSPDAAPRRRSGAHARAPGRQRPRRLARRGPPADRPGRRAHRRRAARRRRARRRARSPAAGPSCGSEDGSPSSTRPDRYTAPSAVARFGWRLFRPERATCLAVSNSLGFVVALEGAWSLKTQQFGDLFGVRMHPGAIDVGFVRLPREFHGGAETMSATLRHRPSGRRRWVRRPLRADRSARLDRSKLSFMVRDRPTIPHRAMSWGGGGRFRNLFSESLILAQDERWRRA